MKARWTTEAVYSDGGAFFSQLEKDIDNAKSKITLETYIFSNDKLGCAVVETLNRAARRGVKVRVMVDGIGSALSSILFLTQRLDKNIKFRVYNPLPWFLFFLPFRKFPTLTHFIKGIFRINHRNHRKTCIIDNKVAFVGGMNISAKQLEWRDAGLRVAGDDVRFLSRAFGTAWRWARFGMPLKTSLKRASGFKPSFLVKLNDTWARRKRSYRELLNRIYLAKERIWITNAYFIPHLSLIQSLCVAAKRGVEVKILVPQNCDLFFVPLVRALYYNELLEAGARIFEFIPTMLHAKTMIIDDWAILGSSNLNHRSADCDLEADVVMTQENCKMKLAEQFLADVTNSREMTLESLKKRSWVKTGSGQALLLLKRWM